MSKQTMLYDSRIEKSWVTVEGVTADPVELVAFKITNTQWVAILPPKRRGERVPTQLDFVATGVDMHAAINDWIDRATENLRCL